jgi:RNA polymerase sigma factor (TIGR02999 family)
LEELLPDAITHRVTSLLRAWTGGDKDAQDELFELVYGELHRLARQYMGRERAQHTLQPTALVNEAYLRLVDIEQVRWQDRTHFFAIAARVMRRILIDSARARLYEKRGGGAEEVEFDEASFATSQSDPELIALDDALTSLAKVDQRKSRVVELRFFGGLSLNETAAAIGVSPDTVTRDWNMAKVWLLREIQRQQSSTQA